MSAACPLATTPSTQQKTANTHTASTTSTGAQTQRRSRSTCTALFTCLSRRRRRILWRRRVRTDSHSSRDERIAILTPRTVRQLSELVSQVKDEQSYIVVRERTHRNTAESTNARVKWWSIFQLLVLSANGGFQVWWLKRFFEVSLLHVNTIAIADLYNRSSALSNETTAEVTRTVVASFVWRSSACSWAWEKYDKSSMDTTNCMGQQLHNLGFVSIISSTASCQWCGTSKSRSAPNPGLPRQSDSMICKPLRLLARHRLFLFIV